MAILETIQVLIPVGGAFWRAANNPRYGRAVCNASVAISVVGLVGVNIWAKQETKRTEILALQHVEVSAQMTKRFAKEEEEKTKLVFKREEEKTKQFFKGEEEKTKQVFKGADEKTKQVFKEEEEKTKRVFIVEMKRSYKDKKELAPFNNWHDTYINAVARAAKGDSGEFKLEDEEEKKDGGSQD